MHEVKSILQDFGLTENEAEVYLILLRLGSVSASDIASKTQIHRINVYDILERLQERGIASYVMIGKRKHYEAADPKKILEIEEERKKNIEHIIPRLEEQRLLAKAQQEATIFKDRRGIRNILEEIPKAKTDVLLFGSGWGFKEKFPDYFPIWSERFRINKVTLRILLSEIFRATPQDSGPARIRYMPNQFVFPSSTLVYEDKVFIIMWQEQPLAILIRGKAVSESYRQFFELLWKSAKE